MYCSQVTPKKVKDLIRSKGWNDAIVFAIVRLDGSRCIYVYTLSLPLSCMYICKKTHVNKYINTRVSVPVPVPVPVHVHLCVCMCVYAYVCVCVCECKCKCKCKCVHLRACACASTCAYACASLCIHVRVSVCGVVRLLHC